jgi:hypothetical protein
VKPPYGVKKLRLCFPQAGSSRKLRRDSCFYNLNGYHTWGPRSPEGQERRQAVVIAGLTIVGLGCEILGAILLWSAGFRTRGMRSDVDVPRHQVDWSFPLGVAVIAQGVCFQLLAAVLPRSP